MHTPQDQAELAESAARPIVTYPPYFHSMQMCNGSYYWCTEQDPQTYTVLRAWYANDDGFGNLHEISADAALRGFAFQNCGAWSDEEQAAFDRYIYGPTGKREPYREPQRRVQAEIVTDADYWPGTEIRISRQGTHLIDEPHYRLCLNCEESPVVSRADLLALVSAAAELLGLEISERKPRARRSSRKGVAQ